MFLCHLKKNDLTSAMALVVINASKIYIAPIVLFTFINLIQSCFYNNASVRNELLFVISVIIYLKCI